MSRSHVAAAILAGGQARRYGGRDKSRLVVEGRAIIVRQIDVLQRVARQTFIVANDPAPFADLGVAVHADLIAGSGALGGVYTALATARTGSVLVVACDMPFLDAGVLGRLIDLAEDADGAWVETARGVEPLLACYRTDAAPRLRAALDAGLRRASDLASVLRMSSLGERELATFGPVDRLLANLNSPEDLGRVQ